MTWRTTIAAIAVLCLPISADADLSTRCDCSRVVGTCGGRVTLDGTTLVVQSSKPQCSQVTWYADDVRHTTIVAGGRSVEEWLGGSTNPAISVENCDVCIDTGGAITCTFPDTSRLVIPDGSVATQDEMIAASNGVKTFQARANGYLDCLERKFSIMNSPEAKAEHNRRHNTAVEQMESVAGRFNTELKAYKESAQ
ncbi:MAG: hypothetical protein ACR2QU_08320 [Gammaproteobacteria bacterium]